MTAPVASLQGGLLDSQYTAHRDQWDQFRHRLQVCRDLGIATLVVACDINRPITRQHFDRVLASLGQIAQEAESARVRVAVEFQAQSTLGNNLQTMTAMMDHIGSPALGICLDVFHYYVGPSQPEDLCCLTVDNLFHTQFCDLADVPREFATDSDRILPGDGDIPFDPILTRLRELCYGGLVAVEVMNPQLWQVPPREFGEIAITALRKVLGQTACGD